MRTSFNIRYANFLFLILFTLLLIGGVSAVGITPLKTDNIISYFRLNESGNFTKNYYNPLNNGTIINSSFLPTFGILNSGGYFLYSEKQSYIQLDTPIIINGSQNISISFWFQGNFNSSSDPRYSFFGNITSAFNNYVILRPLYNRITFEFYSTGTNYDFVYSSNILDLNHYVFVFSSLNTTMMNLKVYVNSNIIGQVNYTNDLLYIGKIGTGYDNKYLNGSLNEIIFYNKSLSNNEIYNLYNNYNGYCGTFLYDSCRYDSNTVLTLDKNDYYLNGSNSGAILITGKSNIKINGNGAKIIGNYLNDFNESNVGLFLYNSNNITIYNLTILNYGLGNKLQLMENSLLYHMNISQNYIGVQTYVDGYSNSSFNNSIFYDNFYRSIEFNSYNLNSVFANNIFYLYNGEGISQATGGTDQFLKILNNTFYQYNTTSSISINRGGYWLIDNNVIYGSSKKLSYAIFIKGQNNTISNNYIFNTQYNIFLYNSYNNTLNNNFLLNGDQGSNIDNSSYIYIINNTFFNMSQNYDAYNIGLKVSRSNNVFIIKNNFSNIATVGLLLQGNKNISVLNNSFNFISLFNRLNYNADDQFEPICSIKSIQTYKGYYGLLYGSGDNLSIFNNYFDNDFCFLQLENQSNLYHDFSNYNYKSFTPLLSFTGKFEFYLPNNFTYLFRFSKSSNSLEKNFRVGGGNTLIGCSLSNCLYLEYNISKNYLFIKNINYSETINYTYFNNLTLIVYSSGIGLFSNNQNNISLTPLNYSYIYPSYSLSEPRISSNGGNNYYEGEPFTLTKSISSNSITYHITSNITNSITVPVNLTDVNCQDLKYVSITPNGLTAYTPNYSCVGDTLYIEDVTLTYSTDSNVILLSYTVPNINPLCDNIFAGYLSFNPFITIFSLIAIVIFVIILGLVFVIANRYNDDNISTQSPSFNFDSKILIGVFLSILVVAILLVISLVVLGNMCSFG